MRLLVTNMELVSLAYRLYRSVQAKSVTRGDTEMRREILKGKNCKQQVTNGIPFSNGP